ncbi:MAG: VCBS repeat-containing protein, partial [Polyangiaceae bacterium]
MNDADANVGARARGAAAAILFVLTLVGTLSPAGCSSLSPGVFDAGDAGSESTDAPREEAGDAALDASVGHFGDAADGNSSDAGVSDENDASDASASEQRDADGSVLDATVAGDSGAEAAGGEEASAGDGGLGAASCNWGFRQAHQLQSDAGMVQGQTFGVHGDLNGDGKQDVVWVDALSSAVEVMLGNGDGTFGPAAAFPIDGIGASIAIGDVNGDGKLDLVVSWSSTMNVLLGKGDGTFMPFVETGGLQATYAFVTLGDLNGDGKLDVVAAGAMSVYFSEGGVTGNTYVSVINVLLGNGDGTFQAPLTVGEATPQIVGSAVLVDLNGDGKEDLVVPAFNSLDVRLGNGDGTFGGPTSYAANSAVAAVVGDWNNDGKPDIAFVNQNTSSLVTLLGNGDGTFQSEVAWPVGPSQATYVYTVDVDGNGTQDLVIFLPGGPARTGASNADLGVLLGHGDGTFQPQRLFFCGAYSEITAPVSPADFNGDGLADFVCLAGDLGVPSLRGNPAGPNSTTLVVLLGDHDGVFGPPAAYPSLSPASLAAGDLNGDGRPDLVTGNPSDGGSAAGLNVLINAGGGSFEAPVAYAAGADPDSVALSDLNADGHLDAVVANGGSGTVNVLLGAGNGTLGSPVSYRVGSNPSFVAVGDLNGDRKPDLVVANASPATDAGSPPGAVNTVSVLLGTGDGTFEAQTTYVAGDDPAGLALSDFNDDGHLDVVVANEGSATVGVLLGNGDGTLGAQVSYATALQPTSVAAGDLNGDGKVDLAVANFGANSISVLYGNGDGTFEAQVPFATGTVSSTPLTIAIGDVDRDGTPDLLASDPGLAVLDMLKGNGDGTFGWPSIFTVGTAPDALTLADFDGDGTLDVAVGSAGNVTVLLACPASGSPDASSAPATGGSVTVTPSSLVFYATCAPQAPTPQSLPITVTNTSAAPVALSVSLSEPSVGAPPPYTNTWFSINVLGETGGVLAAGQSATVIVTPSLTVDPTSSNYTGTIAIRAGGDAGTTQTVQLAEADTLFVAYQPDISLGDVPIGTSVSTVVPCPFFGSVETAPPPPPFGSPFSTTGNCGFGGWTIT